MVFNFVNSFLEAVFEKQHDFANDTFKVLFTNTLPVVSNTQKSDITEISAGGGYTAGGLTATINSSAQTAGVYSLKINELLFTASGNVATFQYIVLYNDTSTNDKLIGFGAYPSPVNILTGESFTIQFGNVSTNGLFTVEIQ